MSYWEGWEDDFACGKEWQLWIKSRCAGSSLLHRQRAASNILCTQVCVCTAPRLPMGVHVLQNIWEVFASTLSRAFVYWSSSAICVSLALFWFCFCEWAQIHPFESIFSRVMRFLPHKPWVSVWKCPSFNVDYSGNCSWGWWFYICLPRSDGFRLNNCHDLAKISFCF